MYEYNSVIVLVTEGNQAIANWSIAIIQIISYNDYS